MDKFTKEKRSKIMSSIKSKNTKPEVLLRKKLWSMGYRYRIYYGKENIDIAFVSKKVAIFLDGCFWHMCPEHGHVPKTREHYWKPKLAKNIERAKNKDERLKSEGWIVIHIWEHELTKMDDVLLRIISVLH